MSRAAEKPIPLDVMLDDLVRVVDGAVAGVKPADQRELDEWSRLAQRMQAIREPLCALVAQLESWRSQLPDGMPIRKRGGRGAKLADLADALSRAACEANVTLADLVVR